MAATTTSNLTIDARETSNSRATRRLRRSGRVPGVLYGLGETPVSFSVDARELRVALQGSGAVLDLSLDGKNQPAVLKDAHRHPVRGDFLHIDLLRVDLNVAIQSTVPIELVGGEEAPGVVDGGILGHITREVLVEALPSDIPESLTHDVSGMQMGDTVFLDALQAPSGVTIVTDPEQEESPVLATVTLPTLEPEPDELETETELVGEDGEPIAAEDGEDAEAAEGGDDDAPANAGDSGSE